MDRQRQVGSQEVRAPGFSRLNSGSVAVKRRWLVGWASFVAIALIPSTSLADSLFNSPVDQLPVQQRVALRNGQALVTGENGRYVGQVLVNASPDAAWAVLTDYSNFAKFLPNMVSSRILESSGNRKVIEQEDVRQVFLVNVRSKVRSLITETYQQRVDFRLIEANQLQTFQGSWRMELVAPYRGAKPNQVLITQTVEVQPKSGTPKGVFYGIFKDSLSQTLSAVAQEIERRAGTSR